MTTTKGKHAHLEVPDFDGGRSSYLRLGAAAPLGSLRGDDLAELIDAFIDDERKRDGCPDFVPVAERKAETARLHTKGGWRDHTDGNRISTTRGDKVEVIEGNYKLLVLGRGEHEAGWDVSGGHITEVSETFGGGTFIEWSQKYGGTWKVSETTVKGEVHSIYHGDVIDEYYGEKKESRTGTETPGVVIRAEGNILNDKKMPELPDPEPKKENPEIIDKTWAKSIASYTGSKARPVPTITDETWAGTMKSTTNASSITDETSVTGEISSTTHAGSIKSFTKVKKEMSDETEAETIKSVTRAARMVSETHGDTDDKTYGNSSSYTEGNSHTVVKGIENTVNLGMVNEVVLGMMNDATLGAQTSLSLGGELNLSLALEAQLSLTASLEFSAGPKKELGSTRTSLHLDKTEVSLTRKILSAMNLYV
jgi:hypothetical protein